eukprot:scaffold4347_cov55-Attheya_sp.AAC.3
MGKAKKTRKFAVTKKVISPKDMRVKSVAEAAKAKQVAKKKAEEPRQCIPCITDCVMGELEKLGGKYKVALRLAKDPRFERIPCSCKGCYADDCITQMAKQWRCFIVATCDKELRGRIRKIPGVPCMFIANHRYTVERMPEAFGAPR